MKINTITIVGGGSAGWMSAAYLSRKNPNVKITLVDKEHGTPVSVGEATILTFRTFMTECGFSIDEWFNEIDATFKSGILFTINVENSFLFPVPGANITKFSLPLLGKILGS